MLGLGIVSAHRLPFHNHRPDAFLGPLLLHTVYHQHLLHIPGFVVLQHLTDPLDHKLLFRQGDTGFCRTVVCLQHLQPVQHNPGHTLSLRRFLKRLPLCLRESLQQRYVFLVRHTVP